MESRWKEIWNNRQVDMAKLMTADEFELYKELKRLDGFDVQVAEEETYYKGLVLVRKWVGTPYKTVLLPL